MYQGFVGTAAYILQLRYIVFQVARAKHKEGDIVIKVFVIHDPSLPLNSYESHLRDIESRMKLASNILPFQRYFIHNKSAMLCRSD